MRNSIALTAIVVAFLLAPDLYSEEYYKGYWRAVTPKGESYPCSLVERESEMLNVLRSAGWDEARIPKIDWTRQCAIVISPSKYYEDGQIAFYGLKWTGSRFELRYGWEPLPSSEQFGANSYSAGSSIGQPETIVVSFEHYVHANNSLVCSNLGFDP